METTISRIVPNNDPTFNFFEVRVSFDDTTIDFQMSAEVIIFLEKNENLTLSEVATQAIQKAHDFLSQIATSH